MDGKINRIKVMLVDNGKNNRWLAMQEQDEKSTEYDNRRNTGSQRMSEV